MQVVNIRQVFANTYLAPTSRLVPSIRRRVMTMGISFRCPGCKARLRAPVQLEGQTRKCPGCGQAVVVPVKRLPDSGPILVFDDRRGPTYSR